MMNPMEMLKSFKGKNPQEIILNQMMGNINNPMLKSLIDMAKKRSESKYRSFCTKPDERARERF